MVAVVVVVAVGVGVVVGVVVVVGVAVAVVVVVAVGVAVGVGVGVAVAVDVRLMHTDRYGNTIVLLDSGAFLIRMIDGRTHASVGLADARRHLRWLRGDGPILVSSDEVRRPWLGVALDRVRAWWVR